MHCLSKHYVHSIYNTPMHYISYPIHYIRNIMYTNIWHPYALHIRTSCTHYRSQPMHYISYPTHYVRNIMYTLHMTPLCIAYRNIMYTVYKTPCALCILPYTLHTEHYVYIIYNTPSHSTSELYVHIIYSTPTQYISYPTHYMWHPTTRYMTSYELYMKLCTVYNARGGTLYTHYAWHPIYDIWQPITLWMPPP